MSNLETSSWTVGTCDEYFPKYSKVPLQKCVVPPVQSLSFTVHIHHWTRNIFSSLKTWFEETGPTSMIYNITNCSKAYAGKNVCTIDGSVKWKLKASSAHTMRMDSEGGDVLCPAVTTVKWKHIVILLIFGLGRRNRLFSNLQINLSALLRSQGKTNVALQLRIVHKQLFFVFAWQLVLPMYYDNIWILKIWIKAINFFSYDHNL